MWRKLSQYLNLLADCHPLSWKPGTLRFSQVTTIISLCILSATPLWLGTQSFIYIYNHTISHLCIHIYPFTRIFTPLQYMSIPNLDCVAIQIDTKNSFFLCKLYFSWRFARWVYSETLLASLFWSVHNSLIGILWEQSLIDLCQS